MSTALVESGRYDEAGMEVLERVVVAGDLARLSPADRVSYYRAVCRSTGLNPLTKPFDYIQLNGRLTLYATRTATDQLRSIKAIAIDNCERDLSDPDAATWIVTGHDATGRVDMDLGSVSIAGLKGEAKANAIMKALTKAKRRLTLSLAGLGWLDETEVGTVPSAQSVTVDTDTGEIVASAAPTARPVALADKVAARRASIEARVTDASEAPAPEPAAAPDTGGTSAAVHAPEATSPPASGAPDEPRVDPAVAQGTAATSAPSPSQAPTGLTAGELRQWLRDNLIGVSEATRYVRERYGDDANIDRITDDQRSEVRAYLERNAGAA